MPNSIFFGEQYTERTLIESILASHYIVDYGYIKAVNTDKTVDVTHAKQLKTLDGESLKATVTKNVEVLTIAGGGFSLSFDYKKGDKVLLLGLKDYVPKVDNVTSATETTAYLHYSRETLKAVPLCVFNSDAKVTVKVESGSMKVDAKSKIELKGESKIELNGSSKQFVTWTELNTALSTFATQLSTALLGATYDIAGIPNPLNWTAGNPPATIDISAAKTTTVVTGG